MAIDPKNTGVRLPVSLPVSKPATPATRPETWASSPPATGFASDSAFDSTARRAALANASEGRKAANGTADDGVGRKQANGTADDGVGRKKTNGTADDGVGRKTQSGTADDGVGRKQTNGTADDGVGRKQTNGTADDGVGRKGAAGTADDGVGRKGAAGTADDGVGRKTKTGTADDGVGANLAQIRDGLFADTPQAATQRQALYAKLETPSFVKPGTSVAAQVTKFAAAAGLSAAEQAQVATVLKGASDSTASLLGALLEKNPGALKSADSRGQTLLSNLGRLATEPLNAKANGTTRGEILESVLRDVVNPQRVDQGDAPTCTVTSMQYELVRDEPAEFTRIIADLTGPSGSAAMRGDGRGQGKLVLDAGETSVRDGRSVADTIFQNAAMEYANGTDATFDPAAQKSVNEKTGAEQRGLKPTQQSHMLSELFGVSYRQSQFYTEQEGVSALQKLGG